MKVDSIQQPKFRGSLADGLASKIAENPKALMGIGALAGSTVVAQKLVMSAGEVAVAPFVDIGVGKAITAITNEKDGRTNQSSKVQAVRTISQTVGGTITGIAIRLLCIGAATALCMKAGKKVGENLGGKIGEILRESADGVIDPKAAPYRYEQKMGAWGKTIGGAAATLVMMVTNFLIDAPFINWINKKISPILGVKCAEQKDQKEVK